MLGGADVANSRVGGGDQIEVIIPVPAAAMGALSAKVGQRLPAGIEGAGTIVAAGNFPEAQALIGKVVALSGGAMYAQYRVANIADLFLVKDGTMPVEAASSFINPLTALGMLDTMRREAYSGLVHTAAASNLGQMLNRACLKDGIPLVNIVRSRAQVELLQAIGAEHIVDSTSESFLQDLHAAIVATDATLCFDVISGGKLASQVLTAMEAAQSAKLGAYSRYGSAVHKQVYICGQLNGSPTELMHGFGLSWSVGGWLLTNYLAKIGATEAKRLSNRVAEELTTTFASHYTRIISLREAMDPLIIKAYHRRATGEKYLIAPHM